MDILAFLRFVITAKQGGWLCIAASLPNGSGWRQYWVAWPEDAETVLLLIQGLIDEGLNVYYSCHLFSEKDSHKEYAMDSRTIFCDLDGADIHTLQMDPSLLLKSSDASHQGYWRLNEWLGIDELEQLSRRLTYGIKRADHSGWNIGHMMRVPKTLNYKYAPPQKVRVISHHDNRLYKAADFAVFPPLEESTPFAVLVDDEWVERALCVPAGHHNLNDFWDTTQTKLPKGSDLYFYNEAPDRSLALWSFMKDCFKGGLKREEVYLLAYHSKNNKFRDLRYGGKQALAKDVLRAEREIFTGPLGIREHITTVRRTTGNVIARKQTIAKLCLDQMIAHGHFIHALGNTLWYILNEEGKPVQISRSSTNLNVVINNMFDLNPTEPEHQYLVAHLTNYVANLPQTGETASLSYYIPKEEIMLLHMGQKTIIRITQDTIDTVINGYKDIIFPWADQDLSDVLKVDASEGGDTWHESIFGVSLANLTTDGVSVEQAVALMRSWFISLLMRNAMMSRPIVAMFGQPGSGKSTMFKKVYALVYGANKAVTATKTVDEFDYGMAADPLMVLDNADSWERWLPDRIARAAGVSEITRRKLWTDTDTVTLKLQAFLGITAFNPKFGREDVMDRLIMLTLERIAEENRHDETTMITNILDSRVRYWKQIINDVQKVLREPIPTREQLAQFRVQDFSKVGQRIANALGYGEAFHSALIHMVNQQKGFVLDEDSILVDVILKYLHDPRYKHNEYRTPGKLWGIFDILSGIDKNFSKQYGNSIKLGRKLWAMQDVLKQRFVVECKFDPEQKTRVWRFEEKNDG